MRFLNLRSSALMVSMSALFVLLEIGCVSKKVPATGSPTNEPYTNGVVTNAFQAEACPWLIRLEDGSHLIPVELADRFKEDGLQVQFTFHYSRVNQGACQEGRPAVIETIVAE